MVVRRREWSALECKPSTLPDILTKKVNFLCTFLTKCLLSFTGRFSCGWHWISAEIFLSEEQRKVHRLRCRSWKKLPKMYHTPFSHASAGGNWTLRGKEDFVRVNIWVGTGELYSDMVIWTRCCTCSVIFAAMEKVTLVYIEGAREKIHQRGKDSPNKQNYSKMDIKMFIMY